MKLKKGAKVREINPTEELLNEDLISRAIWECLKEGDSEGFIEVIAIYLSAVNKTRIAKKASVARSTVYSFKGGNPTVKTLAKVVHACA
jgi:DNA-binding phage protein